MGWEIVTLPPEMATASVLSEKTGIGSAMTAGTGLTGTTAGVAAVSEGVCQPRRRHFEHCAGGTSPVASHTWPQSENSHCQHGRSVLTAYRLADGRRWRVQL
jgi:hypothetical protein